MSRSHSYIVLPLFLVFILHGALYYLFPEMHYTVEASSSGWISSLKYAILAAALPFIVAYRFKRAEANWFLVGFTFLSLALVPSIHWMSKPSVLL